jgi:hypothetical protein
MDDYHFAPWVNQLVAQIWLNLLMDDYHFAPLGEPAWSTALAKSFLWMITILPLG